MNKAMRNVRKSRVSGAVHAKLVPSRFNCIVRNYYAVCARCGYRGNDWPDSGACPACGEIN